MSFVLRWTVPRNMETWLPHKKNDTNAKILRTIPLKWYPQGVPPQEKARTDNSSRALSEFPSKPPEVNHLLDSGLPWTQFWGMAKGVVCWKFICCLVKSSLKHQHMKSKYLWQQWPPERSAPAVRKSLHRRDWAAAEPYSRYSQEY